MGVGHGGLGDARGPVRGRIVLAFLLERGEHAGGDQGGEVGLVGIKGVDGVVGGGQVVLVVFGRGRRR